MKMYNCQVEVKQDDRDYTYLVTVEQEDNESGGLERKAIQLAAIKHLKERQVYSGDSLSFNLVKLDRYA